MPVFTYQAKDSQGQTVSGEVLAADERTAAGQVRQLGYYPMRVNAGGPAHQSGIMPPASSSSVVSPQYGGRVLHQEQDAIKPDGSWFERTFIYPVWTNVSLKDLAIFYRQFSAMINAGMSINRSLTTLQVQSSGTMRKIIWRLKEDVQAGGKLSEGMGRFPHIFSKLQRSIIVAGEDTGTVDIMMARLADYLEADYALRRMVKRETFYPKINIAATFLLPTLVIAVTQGIHSYFQQAVLPLLEICAGIGMAYVAGRFALSVKALAVGYDTVKAFFPYFGYTVRMLAIAKFSRALSALYSAGVLLPSAVMTAADVAGNAYLRDAMQRSVPAMMAGEGLTESFANTGAFPGMFLSMLGTGEETGSLDSMLTKVAEFYEAESALRLHQSVQAIGVLTFLFAAFLVGMVVIKFYTGYGSELNGLMNN